MCDTTQNDEYLKEYRQLLVTAEQKAQEDYDKTVIALSGGALGISFAFVEKFITNGQAFSPKILFYAWIFWACSLLIVLISYYTSHIALRSAIKQVDEGTIYKMRPGGAIDLITKICNALGGIAFIVGVILISVFVYKNIGE